AAGAGPRRARPGPGWPAARAALAHAQHAERQVHVVGHHQQLAGLEVHPLPPGAQRAAALVHVRLRRHEGRRLRAERRAPPAILRGRWTRFGVRTPDQDLENAKADVVSRPRIARPGIAEAEHRPHELLLPLLLARLGPL